MQTPTTMLGCRGGVRAGDEDLADGEVFELGQVGLVFGKHGVDHIADFVGGQHCSRQWIVEDGLVDFARVAANGAVYSQLFDLGAEIGEHGALGW